jgi:hypothetical protein
MRLVGNNRRCKIACKLAVLPQEIVRHVPRETSIEMDGDSLFDAVVAVSSPQSDAEHFECNA